MSDGHDLLEVIEAIDPAACSYEEWVSVGMALKDGGHPASTWENWSRADARYREGECVKKWSSFRGSSTPITGGTLVSIARSQGWTAPMGGNGDGYALSWDDVIGARDEQVVVKDVAWIEDEEVPEPKVWDPVKELTTYLEVLFEAGENVGYVASTWEKDGRHLPKAGNWDRTAGQLIEALAKCKGDIGAVIGDYKPEAGAWIRFNPLDGQGCKNDNVTEFRYALVESDTMSVGKQLAIIKQLELPAAVVVHSGGKSVHAIVRVDAADYDEYRKRVDYLYGVCKKNGLQVDAQNKNPSRLSRMPGIMRGDRKQFIVATNIGRDNWVEWQDWIDKVNDDLPEPENLTDVWDNLPALSPPLIDGVLRQGHKMLLAGPSKAGKSYALIELCCAIAEGKPWYGWQCTQGRVLYVNLELDRASCLHRFKDVYQGLDWTPDSLDNIDTWNLRGKSVPMDKLAPKLIRRAMSKNYIAVVIDPIYKVITGDENSADQMAKFCNQFDLVAAELGCAVIYCHHHSKGSQGQKRSADRASGSGVFARDPDTLIDLIELELTDDIIKQQMNDRSCVFITSWLDRHGHKALRSEMSQDTQVVEHNYRSACREALPVDDMNALIRDLDSLERRVRGASAWRIEGTLREYPKFNPVNLWFDYPVHVVDTSGVLSNLDSEGQAPPWKKGADKRKKAAKKERVNKHQALIDAIEQSNFGEPPTTAQAMTYMGLDPKDSDDKQKFNRLMRSSGEYVKVCTDQAANLWTIRHREAGDEVE